MLWRSEADANDFRYHGTTLVSTVVDLGQTIEYIPDLGARTSNSDAALVARPIDIG